MIAGPFKRNFSNDEPAQCVGEKPPGRVKNGGMVKTGCPGRWRRSAAAFPRVEPEVMMITACRNEGRPGPAGCERKTQHTAVEIERPLQIRDLEVHVTDPDPRVDCGHPQGIFLDGFRFRHWVVLAVGASDPHM